MLRTQLLFCGRSGRRGTVALAACLVLAFACASLAEAQTPAAVAAPPNPVPFINQPLVPTAVAPGSAAFTLTVNGTGFVSGSVVQWNGHPLATTFVSNKRVTAAVTAVFVANPGTGSVTVVNPAPGGGRSNVVFFPVTNSTTAVFLGSAPGSPITVGTHPRQTVVADFNGDGIPDLAVVNNSSNTVTILLGNGDGTFRQASTPATGNGPASVAVGDFNGDGKLDLAVANSGDNTVSILLGNGDGTFQAQTTFATAAARPIYVITADFNGDGKLDLAVGEDSTHNVSILLGNGNGTFQPFVDYPGGSSLATIATGDFNGDGILDLAVSNELNNTVTILLGNGSGGFVQASSYATGTSPFFVSVADFNGDGKLDLAVANANCTTFPTACGAGSVSILLGNGDGTFQTHVEYATGSATASMISGDFNGDGLMDLAAANFNDNTVSVLLGNGNGTFRAAVNYPTAGTNPISPVFGDFNGDGRLDFAVSNNASNNVSVLLQVAAVTLSSASSSQSLNFGNQVVNTTSASQTVMVTNNQTTPLTFSSISTTGNFAETNTCPISPATLAAGANCTVSVTFTPTTVGPQTGTLSISDNAANSPQTFNLFGTGVNVAQLSTTTLNFGNQVVNTTSGPRTETLKNFGSTAITITSIVATAPFAQTNTCGTSLAAGATCNLVITFTPTTLGAQTGSITITDSAPLSPQTINLTGNGIAAPPTSCPAPLAMLQNYGKLPLMFEANLGQTDPAVKFLSRGRGYSLFLTPTEAVLNLQKSGADSRLRGNDSGQTKDKGQGTRDAVLRMQLVGANPTAKVTGLDEQPGKSNYFIGNDPAKWVRHAPTYAKVRYEQVYPGIDLVYYGDQRQLEYDFVVKPGADPKAISLALVGAGLALPTVAAVSDRRSAVGTPPLQKRAPQAAPLQIAANGDLLINTGSGEARFHKPVVYQEMESGVRSHESVQDNEPQTANHKSPPVLGAPITNHKFLDGHYVLTADNRIAFEVPGYDRSKTLIIDPVLTYATYLGGSGADGAFGIAVDASCSAYITGGTESMDFPTSATAKQTTYGGTGATCQDISFACGDAFVTKLSPDGTAVVYSTYLGGSDKDFAYGIAVDSTGSAYVAGQTASTNFPTTASAFQTSLGSTQKGIVARLSPDGSSLVYSTYLGGSTGDDHAFGIAIDGTGDAYVTGFAESSNFPVTGGAYQTTLNCHTSKCANAFVAKINTNASGAASLVYATYLGGNVKDEGLGIATDASGNAYVTGSTSSTNFPVMNAFQRTFGGGDISCGHHSFVCGDAFVTKLNATGTALLYSTYLGGSGEEAGVGIAVDSSGAAYATGGTDSSDFPTTAGAFQTTFGGGSTGCANTGFACGDGYVAKFDTTKSGAASLIYSTYLGGSGDDIAGGVAVDSTGSAYVSGITNSSAFPLTPDATQGFFAGGTSPCTVNLVCGDAFVTKVNPNGSSLAFSTYLGGSGDDGGFGLALDSQGNAYVTGVTDSTNFPVTAGAFQTTYGGGVTDAFVARISGLNAPRASLSPPSLAFSATEGTTSAPQMVTLTNSGTSSLSIASIAITGTGFAESNNCPISPQVLLAKSSCTLSVTFAPPTPGSFTGSITVTDNATGSPQTVTLSGTGFSLGAVTFSTTSLTFGQQALGSTSAAQTVTLTNSGTGPLGSISITTAGDFAETNNCPVAPATLAVNARCTISVTFSPIFSGPATGSVIVTDDASTSPQTVALSGTGVSLVTPASIAFLSEGVGFTTPPQTVTVTNNSSNPLTISSVTITGTNAGDFAQTNSCPATLAVSATCTISVTFTPTATGSRSATLLVNTNIGAAPVSLSGTGYISRLTPTALSFVAQTVGTTSPLQSATLINVGATSLTISGTSSLAGTDFAESDSCGGTVPAHGTCTLNFKFTPSAVGTRSSTFSVTTNAPEGTLSTTLDGTGITVSVSPPSLLFDNQGVGTTSAPQTVTFTNKSSTAITISSISTSHSAFAQTNTCGTSLAGGASCTISVTFTPGGASTYDDDAQSAQGLIISSSAADGTQYVSLLGVGEILTQSTRLLFFGPQAVGTTSAAQTVTLSNPGTGAVDISGVTPSGDFAQTNTCGTSVAAGASCTVSITFTPTVAKPRSGNLTITSSIAGTLIVALYGNTPIATNPGFSRVVVPRIDDGSTFIPVGSISPIPLPFTINFFGNQYNGVFVGADGYITFDKGISTYTPFGLSSTDSVIVAPFFADVDTRAWPRNGSSLFTYGTDTVGGHAAFGVNYLNVGYYNDKTDKLDTFQVLLINRADVAPGDFDIEFNYGKLQWEAGDVSCTPEFVCPVNGLGGVSAVVGFSNGTELPNTFYTQPGSAVNGALLDTNATTGLIYNSLNSPNVGQYIFNVRAGAVVPPGFSASPSPLTFPNTTVGASSSPLTVTVTNTGGSSFTISNVTVSGDFSQTNTCLTTLGPGGTCTVNVTFTPTATGARTGTLTFTDSAPGSPQTVALSGTGLSAVAVMLAPTSLTFTNQNVGTTSPAQAVTLTNTGAGTLSITSIAASGDFAQTNTCGSSVAGGANCTISITFTPTATGARTGAVTITDNASNSPQSISLTGTGVANPVVSLSATTLTLPDTHVNQTCVPGTVTVTNTGGAALAISSITISGQFTETNTCPASLAAGSSCAVTVTFVPTAVGLQTGTLTINSNAASSPDHVALSGNGLAPCLLSPAAASSSLFRGADSTTFTIVHHACKSVGTVQLSCTNQNPAVCTFNPATITVEQPTTLTLSNLKAVTAGTLLFQVHGDAAQEDLVNNLTVLFQDFLMTSAPASQTISAGGQATFSLAMVGQNGLTGTIALSCAGAPLGATCNVSQPSVTLDGTNPADLTVTVSTTSRGLAPPAGHPWGRWPSGGSPWALLRLAMLALLSSAGLRLANRRSRSGATTGAPARLRLATIAAGLLVAAVTTWVACGGGSTQTSFSSGTPAGTYNLTVTATYNIQGSDLAIVHNSTVQLTVH